MKSTVVDPVDIVFGFTKVLHKPALTSSMPLANLLKKKRCLYWDDYRPVEYASAGTVPVSTFLSLFGRQYLEVQVSQSFHDGNPDVRWTKGAVMTAKADGLWDVMRGVDREDIRHMQSRVEQFEVGHTIQRKNFVHVPTCAESFCWWVLHDGAKFAARTHWTPPWWSWEPCDDDDDDDDEDGDDNSGGVWGAAGQSWDDGAAGQSWADSASAWGAWE
jgi:hypothetical protein